MEVKALIDKAVADHNEKGISLLQVEEEITTLAHIVKSMAPINYLEIGIHCGSAFTLLGSLCSGKKLGVDIKLPWPQECMEEIEKVAGAHLLMGDSPLTSTFDKVVEFCPQYDLIFIDGDHTYEGVKKDFEMYRGLLSPNGIIVFHDIDPNHRYGDGDAGQVYKFWQELDEGSKTDIICSRGGGRIRIGGYLEGFGGIGIWRPPSISE